MIPKKLARILYKTVFVDSVFEQHKQHAQGSLTRFIFINNCKSVLVNMFM